MESNNESMDTDVRYCTCYYFGDIINIKYLDLDTILLDKKSYENHMILHTTPFGAKALRIIFDKINGNIKKYDKTQYLSLFCFDEKCERIFDRIRCFFMLKKQYLRRLFT